MKKIFKFIAILCLPATLYAKPRAYIDFQNDEISLIVDGKACVQSFWHGLSHCREAFAGDPRAYDAMHQSYKDAQIGNGLILGLGIGVPIALALSRDRVGLDRESFLGLYSVSALTGLVLGGRYMLSAQKNFFRAINQYNGIYDQAVQDLESRTWSMSFVPTLGGGLELGLSREF